MNHPTREELLPFISVLLTPPEDGSITSYALCSTTSCCDECVAFNSSKGASSLCLLLGMFGVDGDYDRWLDISNYARLLFPSTEFPEYYL